MTILTVFGAANQQKWLKSKNSFWNLFRVRNVIENEGSHQYLKIVPFFTSYLLPYFLMFSITRYNRIYQHILFLWKTWFFQEHRNTEHQQNTGGTPEHWCHTANAGRIPEHWQNNETLVEQSEYHGIVEHEKSSRIMEQQENAKEYYQYRKTTYWADKITKFKTIKFF